MFPTLFGWMEMTMRKRVNLFLVHVWPLLGLVTLLVGEARGLVHLSIPLRSSTTCHSHYHHHRRHGHRKDPTTTELHCIMRRRRSTTALSSTSTPSVSASGAAPVDGSTKKPSIVAATFTLIKACVGSGVLALPSGLALLSDLPKA